MKKKFFSVLITALCLVFCLSVFTGCGGNGYEPVRNVKLNLLDKVHVEYFDGGKVFVKDGDYYFGQGGCYSMSGRGTVLIKENLNSPAITSDYDGREQYFISAIWNGSEWKLPGQEYDDASMNPSPYIANDQNHTSIFADISEGWHIVDGPYNYLYKGYSDVNQESGNGVTVTKLENDTLQIGGNDVECVVWERVNTSTYTKDRYWFAVNTNILIKHAEVIHEEDDILAPEAVELVATYYAEGETLDSILEAKGISTFAFPAQYN